MFFVQGESASRRGASYILFCSILVKYLRHELRVVGHNAVDAHLDKHTHLVGVVDRPVLHGDVSAVRAVNEAHAVERDLHTDIVRERDLQAREVALIEDIHKQILRENEVLRRSHGRAAEQMRVIRLQLLLNLVVERTDHDLILVLGVSPQRFSENSASLPAHIAAVLDLHDEQQVGVGFIGIGEQLLHRGDLQAHSLQIGGVLVNALAVFVLKIVAEVVLLQLGQGHVLDVVVFSLVVPEVLDLVEREVAVDVARLVNVAVVVVYEVTVLSEVEVALDDVDADRHDCFAEREEGVLGVVVAASAVSRDHGKLALSDNEGVVLDVLLRGDHVDHNEEKKDHGEDNAEYFQSFMLFHVCFLSVF